MNDGCIRWVPRAPMEGDLGGVVPIALGVNKNFHHLEKI